MESPLQHVLYDKQNAILVEQQEVNLVATLKARIFPDGNQWCVMYGANIQESVCGFGDTPILAVYDFNRNFYSQTHKR